MPQTRVERHKNTPTYPASEIKEGDNINGLVFLDGKWKAIVYGDGKRYFLVEADELVSMFLQSEREKELMEWANEQE